mmetsp:Transcript_43938/g.93483  ORF Transcript_43938/g.93483 Transcript_43938/m.93483 type:complete len:242 (-) Transcript_43938:9-734(-)
MSAAVIPLGSMPSSASFRSVRSSASFIASAISGDISSSVMAGSWRPCGVALRGVAIRGVPACCGVADSRGVAPPRGVGSRDGGATAVGPIGPAKGVYAAPRGVAPRGVAPRCGVPVPGARGGMAARGVPAPLRAVPGSTRLAPAPANVFCLSFRASRITGKCPRMRLISALSAFVRWSTAVRRMKGVALVTFFKSSTKDSSELEWISSVGGVTMLAAGSEARAPRAVSRSARHPCRRAGSA